MSVFNSAFGKIFSNVFVYNILFEDSETDCKYMNLEKESKVLTIAGAGCGVAALLSYHPQSIDVVDSNLSHLSLSAIKMLAPRYLSYDDFYQLFGYGKSDRAREMVFSMLQDDCLPHCIKNYWQKKYDLFLKGLYESGLTTQMLRLMFGGISRDPKEWLEFVTNLPEEKRVESVKNAVAKQMSYPALEWFIRSPLMLLCMGINFQQKAKIERTANLSFYDYVIIYIQKVARTDFTRNWFVWQSFLREFNHQDNLAIPPYLRRDFYAKSLLSETEIAFHHGKIEKVLSDRPADYWSYVNLSDILDWMNDRQKNDIMKLLYQKVTAGAIVLIRSVEDIDFIERFNLQDQFSLLQDISDRASREDRSCLYNRVNFYQVIK